MFWELWCVIYHIARSQFFFFCCTSRWNVSFMWQVHGTKWNFKNNDQRFQEHSPFLPLGGQIGSPAQTHLLWSSFLYLKVAMYSNRNNVNIFFVFFGELLRNLIINIWNPLPWPSDVHLGISLWSSKSSVTFWQLF